MTGAEPNGSKRDKPRPMPMKLRNALLTRELTWMARRTAWRVAWRADAQAVVEIPGLPLRQWLHELVLALACGDWTLIKYVRPWRRSSLWRECVVGEDGVLTWSTLGPVSGDRYSAARIRHNRFGISAGCLPAHGEKNHLHAVTRRKGSA